MRALLAGTALTLLMGAPTALAIDVSSDADLRAAIEIARTTPNTTINLLNSITLTSELPALQGTGTVINGNGNTLNGNNQFRGLLVYSGSVQVGNLIIASAAARGGFGAPFAGGGAGGLRAALDGLGRRLRRLQQDQWRSGRRRLA